MANNQLELKTQTHSYLIHVGSGLLSSVELYPITGKQVVIITNDVVAPLYLEPVKKTLEAKHDVYSLVIPDGEEHKTLIQFSAVIDWLVANNIDRKATIIALGGGVIGDLAGFVAASYQRGIPFIQVPTTLLAQVDASVGGKTAVNHPSGKNLIGAFYQPQAVIIDTDTLNTLPEREYRSGLAEVIKYGLIRDESFFTWLDNYAGLVMKRDPETIVKMITKSCQHKIELVTEDEREQGQRALLNLGHTFGHAIESAQNYSSWLHGEAVSAGMVCAAMMSNELGWLDKEDLNRVISCLERLSLPTHVPSNLKVNELVELMKLDKKVQNQVLRLILLKDIGDAVIHEHREESGIKLSTILSACQSNTI